MIFTNLELFRQDGLKKMGTITTIANLLKKNTSAVDLQKAIFAKLESKGSFKKADFAISLLYKKDFYEIIAPAYIQEGFPGAHVSFFSNPPAAKHCDTKLAQSEPKATVYPALCM